jgi:thymidine phosphorylase
MSGTLYFVVGASGVGKDSLIEGARAALADNPAYVFARRVITRPADAGGEAHEEVDAERFAVLREAGHFLVHWQAHGLSYGLPSPLREALHAGRHVIANGSRAAIPDASRAVARLVVVEIDAPAAIVAERLKGRGRESQAEIAARLARITPPPPEGVEVRRVVNDATLEIGVGRLLAALDAASPRLRLRRVPIDTWRHHVVYLPQDEAARGATEWLGTSRVEVRAGGASICGRVNLVCGGSLVAPDEVGLSASAFEALGVDEGAPATLRAMPQPESLPTLRAKLRGERLPSGGVDRLIRDIAENRYNEGEIAAFLMAATTSLSDEELIALACARTEVARRITWDEPIVVDKHSLGGVPGSRITLIVVPIVAAHGLAIPKTSSRAITSAAGTADAMETLARVDLDMGDVRRTVESARGCIAWNGRLTHSPLDDVMNALTRPLGLESSRWSVASILSKKAAAGSTHVIVDIPWGPGAKVKDEAAATDLAGLFRTVGHGLGLVVEAHATRGGGPIGRGIGPALEVRDVRLVLENRREAPHDLREKALFFAARILAWDPSVGSPERGRERAERLLASGAAHEAFERIVDAQGRRTPPALPGAVTAEWVAERDGLVEALDGWAISGIARRAGAPAHPGAGVDILATPGTRVERGQPLMRIHARSPDDLSVALDAARREAAFRVSEPESVTRESQSTG